MGTMAAYRGTRTTNRLTDLKVRKLARPGRHADGAGLYFDISPEGTRHWVFLYTRNGRRRELGLGGYPDTSLVEARAKGRRAPPRLEGGEDSTRGTIGRPASRRAPYDGRSQTIKKQPVHWSTKDHVLSSIPVHGWQGRNQPISERVTQTKSP
jgi:hypothetical protein